MSRSRRAALLPLLAALALAGCTTSAPSEPGPAPEATEPAGSATPDIAAPPDDPAPAGFAPLTGAPLDEDGVEMLTDRPVLIVKVENSPQARPQAGLDAADVVVEELVEGGVTRFMALFHSQLPGEVGPVRSARPVDVAFGSGFGAPVFASSGARPEVQGQLRASSMVVLEEGAPGFTRVADRRAPHDLFVRPTDVLAAGIDRGAAPLSDGSFAFDDAPPSGAATCADEQGDCEDPGDAVSVAMSRQAVTGWGYDEAAGVYRREQDGEASVVTGDGRIGAANVVLLATRQYSSGCCDAAGSPYIDTEVVGDGRAVVYRDGEQFEATWAKASATEPLELLSEDGETSFPLKPGPTWMLLASAGALPVGDLPASDLPA